MAFGGRQSISDDKNSYYILDLIMGDLACLFTIISGLRKTTALTGTTEGS